ncbi:MAG: AAA family ATPase [Candidatus Bathyarchaeota archaeon]|nr:AAA family ATPase [Candidatus Bathyarchaeota archaeon]
MTENEPPRISTGVTGLDEMLGGGMPDNSILLVCGGSGVGKTIFTLQYMMAATDRREPCVYVSLEESMKKKIKNALAFGWDVSQVCEKGLVEYLDLFMVPHSQGVVEPVDRVRGKLQFSIDHEIEMLVKKINAKHIILDPLTSILVHEQRSGKKRFLIGKLFESIRNLGCSAVITTEGMPKENDFYMEMFLADGVVLLGKDIKDYKLTKTIRIDKMRGIDFDDQPRRYAITSRGFQVFSKEPVLI